MAEEGPVTITEWLFFLEKKYKKNIRSVEDAKIEFKPKGNTIEYIIYPDVTNEQAFFIFSYGTGFGNKFNLYKLKFNKYMENTGQIEFYKYDNISNIFKLISEKSTINSITTTVSTDLLLFAYSDKINQVGGRRRSRRHSRKAKKNKAHTPQ